MKQQLHAGTYSCRAVSDGDAGCGGPQCSGGSVIVSEADLGLSWEKEHTHKEIKLSLPLRQMIFIKEMTHS